MHVLHLLRQNKKNDIDKIGELINDVLDLEEVSLSSENHMALDTWYDVSHCIDRPGVLTTAPLI